MVRNGDNASPRFNIAVNIGPISRGRMSYKGLLRGGLTNQDTEDLGVICMGRAIKEIYTYCSSTKCCSYARQNKRGFIVRGRYERVLKQTKAKDYCPDCGESLFFREGSRL